MKFVRIAAWALAAMASNIGAVGHAQNAPDLPSGFELVATAHDDTLTGATYARIVSGAPIVLVLQGSGCDSVWRVNGDAVQGTATQDLIARLAPETTVAVVDKPGVAIGDQKECGASFTLDVWTEALDNSLQVVREAGGYDGPIAALGISEGAVTAARLAGNRSDIGHVAFVSAVGCGLIDDMLANASRQAVQVAEPDGVGVQDRVDQAILAAEEAAMMIFAEDTPPGMRIWGHPITYWRSFGMACPAADLAASDAEVFVAYGTADPQINAGAVEEIAVRRMAAGKVTRMRRIVGGDHTLGRPDDPSPYATLIEVLTEAVSWLNDNDSQDF